MSNDFSYESPDPRSFLKTLIKYLRSEGETEITDLISNAECSINASSQFSNRRWNGLYTSVTFRIPVERLSRVTEEIETKLTHYCDRIMPKDVGYDVGSVDFSPLLEAIEEDDSILEEISEAVRIQSADFRSILPDDILEKGKEMSEIYTILYCVENSLRLFIDNVFRQVHGENYTEDQIQISSSIKKGIEFRRQQEQKNQWLSIRGDSYLFYLDFKELGSIISRNWTDFEPYFPYLEWIAVKINELGECRNHIAHNSYIGQHERQVIQINYISILKQIGAIQ